MVDGYFFQVRCSTAIYFFCSSGVPYNGLCSMELMHLHVGSVAVDKAVLGVSALPVTSGSWAVRGGGGGADVALCGTVL